MAAKQPTKTSHPAIVWFTRDLRLADNPALTAAAASGRSVIAAYIHDPEAGGPWAIGAASQWWLHHSLTALAADLKARGAKLILRRGPMKKTILALATETQAAELHTAHALEPAARTALDALEPLLAAQNCALHRYFSTILFDPASIRTGADTPFGVYTPFSKACRAQPIHEAIAAPKNLTPGPAPALLPAIASDNLQNWHLLPTHPDWAGGMRETWTPGESGAMFRAKAFVKTALGDYNTARDLPGSPGTSMLSPHLHYGEISARQLWHLAAPHGGKGPYTFCNEILWREFNAHILWSHSSLPDAPLRPAFAAMKWHDNAPALHAWQRGQTGIPIVDAGMRQLWHIGWQHNRVRMIAASFLIKHLLIDWTVGEKWFWDCLVDADLGSNAGNWQWVAGCGLDAAPFFRIFNPWLQGQKFDPEGAYIRQWVPELARLPDEFIHGPAEAPALVLHAAGVALGENYPYPIIDLKEGRNRALLAFKNVTEQRL